MTKSTASGESTIICTLLVLTAWWPIACRFDPGHLNGVAPMYCNEAQVTFKNSLSVVQDETIYSSLKGELTYCNVKRHEMSAGKAYDERRMVFEVNENKT